MITARDHAVAFFTQHPDQSLTIQQLSYVAQVHDTAARAVLRLMCDDGLATRVLRSSTRVADEYFGTPKLQRLGR